MTTVTTAPAATTLTDEQLDAIKTKQQTTWASGDFAVIGTTLQLTGELLCEAVGVEAGLQVLDAAGNGNAALAGPSQDTDDHRFPRLHTALLEGAATQAAASGLRLTTREADAEALPFPDASFDAVLSVFGVMFVRPSGPRPSSSGSVASRGRIGLVASWTPGSFHRRHVPGTIARQRAVAAGAVGLSWGDEEVVERLLGPAVELTSVQQRVRVPLLVGAGLRGHIPHLLRTDPPRLRRP